jgi:hypothetical protein
MDTFADLIAAWPSTSDLAGDLGVTQVTVRSWRRRGVPGAYWADIEAAAQRRGLRGIDLSTIARLGKRRHPRIRISVEDAAAGRAKLTELGEAANG